MHAEAVSPRPARRSIGAPLARPRPALVLAFLWLGLLIVLLAGTAIGPVSIAPVQAIAALVKQIGVSLPVELSPQHESILIGIRLPRVVLAMLVGAALGMGGAALQGLFRNPLADPGLLGVSSGGALGAVTVIVLGASLVSGDRYGIGAIAVPVAAFLGAFAAAATVYAIARRQGYSDRATMLLAGIAVNAVAGSATGLLVYLSDSEQLKSLSFWLMGSLGNADWHMVAVAALFTLLPVFFLRGLARPLNAMLMGDAVAGHLGFDPVRINRVIVLLVTAMVGAAVAVSGIIGFIGLIAPHAVRLIAGPDHRVVLPGAALAGAILLAGADIFARTVAAPSDLPIGVVTGALGGPFFIWLLMRPSSHGRPAC